MKSHNPSRRSLVGGLLAGLFGWLPSKTLRAREQPPTPDASRQNRITPAEGGILVYESNPTFTSNASETFGGTDSFAWISLPAPGLR